MLDGYVSVANVAKVFKTRHDTVEALRDVNFTAEQGEFIAILGPSGCGKGTLLMMCGGLESVTSGSIRMAGLPMVGARSSTGVMFQDPTLLPWMTVLDRHSGAETIFFASVMPCWTSALARFTQSVASA